MFGGDPVPEPLRVCLLLTPLLLEVSEELRVPGEDASWDLEVSRDSSESEVPWERASYSLSEPEGSGMNSRFMM